jgi:hypothetical protein
MGAAPNDREKASALARLTGIVGSFGFASVLLLTLLLLTFVGTLEQSRMSLYDVQRKYFESLFLIADVGPVSLPLPGATLVLSLLALNLVVGGVARLRKRWTTAGILTAHLGILLLLGGALVESIASDKGQMTLHEGEASDEFRSYYEWELAVVERKPDGSASEFVVPYERLAGLREGDVLRAVNERLPFDVVVTGWTRNALPRAGRDGWVAEARPAAMDAERNIPAATVTLAIRSGGESPRALIWGAEEFPWAMRVRDRTFEVDLRTRRWEVPFTIRLNKFVHKEHPGTSMASEFSSYITKVENGVESDRHITMNAPLRHRGYTFYQSGWGPKEGSGPVFSTFAVVRNPSDRIPEIACWVIAAGLLFHFGWKVGRHIVAEARRRRPEGAKA